MVIFLFSVSPQILLFPVNQSVIDGDPVNFTCHARGVPTPKLTWTLDGHKLPLGINQRKFERDSFLESFLEMQRATKEMAGTYKCTAENKANRTSYSTTLQVFGGLNNYNDYDDDDNTDRDDDDCNNDSNSNLNSNSHKGNDGDGSTATMIISDTFLTKYEAGMVASGLRLPKKN